VAALQGDGCMGGNRGGGGRRRGLFYCKPALINPAHVMLCLNNASNASNFNY